MLDWFGRKLREMQEVKRDERGFTLIELLVVVIIIGILAAIAIPVFLAQRENAQLATVKSDVRNSRSAVMLFLADDGTVPEGTYAQGTDNPSIDPPGGDLFTPSEGVTITIAGSDPDTYTITGSHADLDADQNVVYDANTDTVDTPPAT